MVQAKIFEILSLFNRDEQKKFLKLVQSPYFNNESTLIRATEFLIASFQNSTPNKNKKEIHQAIFGQKPYNDTAIRVVFSKLYKLLCIFLNLEANQKNQVPVLKYLRKNHIEKHFIQILNQSRVAIENEGLKNEYYFDQSYNLYQEEYEFLKLQKRQGEYKAHEILYNIENAYFIKKLRHAVRINNIKTVNNITIDFPFMEHVLKHIDDYQLYNIPVLGYYYYSYLLQIHPSREEYFEKMRSMLLEHEAAFDADELRDNYFTLINYCIRKINEGSFHFNLILFNLYSKALDKGFLLEKGVISRFTYRNIAENGIKIGEYNWVDQFLFEFKIKLEKQYRTSFYSLQKARLYIVHQKYNEALELLSRISFEDPLIELANRLEKIRIFVELNEFDLAFYQLEAMQTYLRRNTGIGYHREHYQNFIHYTKRILKCKFGDTQSKLDLVKLIENESKVTERKWLIKILLE